MLVVMWYSKIILANNKLYISDMKRYLNNNIAQNYEYVME